MSFDKIFDLTAGVYFYFYNIYMSMVNSEFPAHYMYTKTLIATL